MKFFKRLFLYVPAASDNPPHVRSVPVDLDLLRKLIRKSND